MDGFVEVPDRRVGVGDIVPGQVYRRIRLAYQARIRSHRRVRRLRLGDTASLMFETRETVLWHLHEVLRVEGFRRRRMLQLVGEVEPLQPRAGELRATVMIDAGSANHGETVARALAVRGGLKLWLGATACHSVPASQSTCPFEPVWYLHFCPSRAWLKALAQGGMPLVVERSWTDKHLTFPTQMRQALAEDLLSAGRGLPSYLHRLAAEMNQEDDQSNVFNFATCP